jgi:mRNA interferase RelE/StbE
LAYSVAYKNSVQHDLRKLDKDIARNLLDTLERELAAHAHAYPLLKGEFAGLRKLRIGNYRVIYAILGNEVLVLRIRHRKDAYR